jgi:hypothetical protein
MKDIVWVRHLNIHHLSLTTDTASSYIFTIWKCIVYHRLCRDGIYFDKILVSEYKPFKRSNKANLFIALVENFFHWYILQSWKLKKPQIQLRPYHFWTYTSNLTTVIKSVLKFMINFNFKIINFPNMCSNIPASPAYGVYISQQVKQLSKQHQSQWSKCQRHFYVTHW